MKILIADDDPVWRRMIEAMLVEFGDEVVAVGDGLQAWQALEAQQRPSLAILDWVMPGMDGVDICRRVRQATHNSYVYILLLTVKDRKADLAEAFAAGADDYISKPFDPLELKGRLMAARRVIGVQEALLEAQRELRIRASRDSLTGLWNRGAILELLDQELARGRRTGHPVSVLIADVDHFKLVNDTHGHEAGDRVLEQVAERIGSVARGYDAVGRYGGEELLILLSGCDATAALATAERIRRIVEGAPFDVGGPPLAMTVSIGVASTSQLAETSGEGLIRSADGALYRGKRAGRNRVELGGSEGVAAAIDPR